MGDIIGWIGLSVVFFGLEIVALFILIMAWRYARQLVFVLLCGGVAAVLMAIESFAWICVAGQTALQGTDLGFWSAVALIGISAISIVSLGIYFRAAVMRWKRTQKSAAPVGG